jgi:DNA-binding beta-propeller fold protein YncE
MLLPDSSVDTLTSINVRATEFTVGERGPQAMPAALPASSGYTYAVELSVDEALSAGARSVEFSQPVPFYVDNFLDIATGLLVPVGTYDPIAARWVPEVDGRVLKLLSASPVQVAASFPDTTTPASQALLDSLGISAAELSRLAALYPVGKTVWRVELTHFSTVDANMALGEVDHAEEPKVNILRPLLKCQNQSPGSIIGCEGQTLGEDIGVAGTPFTLHYQTDRNLGYGADREIEIPALFPVDTAVLSTRALRTNEFPSHALTVEYRLDVAGRTIRFQRPGGALIEGTTLSWDGLDAYGRVVNGSAKAKVKVVFEYPNLYAVASGGAGGRSFGRPRPPGTLVFGGRASYAIIKIWQGTLGSWDDHARLGLGGWSLSPHHVYDPTSGTLLLGSGERRAAATLGNVATIIPATRGSKIGSQWNKYGLGLIAVAPDGRLVLPYEVDGPLDNSPGIIRILGTDGTFVDSIPNAGRPRSVALAPDGSIYYAEQDSHRVWVRTPDGARSVFAGTGTFGFSGDGGPATAARLCQPDGIALGPDGSLFIADVCNNRIRRVGPDGIISTYAGTGSGFDFVADGQLATQTPTVAPRALAFLPDGTLIYAALNLVRQVRADGRVRTVAGCVQSCPGPTPATAVQFTGTPPLGPIVSLAVEPDGSVLFAPRGRVYRARLDGSLEVVAGVGPAANGRMRCLTGIGCDPLQTQDPELASQTVLEGVVSLAVGPDGTIYLAEALNAAFKAYPGHPASLAGPIGHQHAGGLG